MSDDRSSQSSAALPHPYTNIQDNSTPRASASGTFIDACSIDLPMNDVIEAIEFERFFLLNLQYGRLQSPPAGDDSTSRIENLDDSGETLPENKATTDVASMELALYLPFRQEWKLRGYSRGRLVNSFTLGPDEEQTIDIFKWDRLTRSMESTASFESEQTTESSSSRRDTSDVASDIARQTGFETKSDGKVGFQVGVAKFDLSAGFDARTSVNDAEKTTRNSIAEATARSTGHVRTSRTLKVVEGREYGQETRITRRLRNANKCHSLTIAFFEILANYAVSTFVQSDGIRLVVLIDSDDLEALVRFDRDIIRAHETPLRLALLDSSLADGFAAARYLDARDRACAVLCEGCVCDDSLGGETSSEEWTALTEAVKTLGALASTIRGWNVVFPLSLPAAVANLPSGTTDVKRHLFFEALAINAPRLLSDLSALGIGATAASVTVAQVEGVARILGALPPDAIARLLYDPAVASGAFWEIQPFVMFGRPFGVPPLPPIAPEFFASLGVTDAIKRNCGNFTIFDEGGLVAATNVFRSAYSKWKKMMQEKIDKDEKAAALQKLKQEERELRVLEAFPLRETADARERLDALLAHLNDSRNRNHYRFAIWNERGGSTDPILIQLALQGFIDPTPVGMVGDQLAVPVKIPPNSALEKFFTGSIADLVDGVIRDEREYILPTPALYSESIVGVCCSCEDDIVRETQLNLEHMALDNRLLELEAERLRARLDSKPPLLDKGDSGNTKDKDTHHWHYRWGLFGRIMFLITGASTWRH